jgi:dUTP pyrophosphatase
MNITDESMHEYYENRKSKEGDAGVDLFFPETLTIEQGETKFIKMGVRTQMKNENGDYVSYYLYPRSSISKTSLMLANHVGIVDSGYTGEIIVALRAIFGSYTIQRGDRLVQLCAPTLSPLSVEFATQLEETMRGDGGFGSTGK